MDILEELQDLIDNGLCRECHAVLTDEEVERGYLCNACVFDWMGAVCWDAADED